MGHGSGMVVYICPQHNRRFMGFYSYAIHTYYRHDRMVGVNNEIKTSAGKVPVVQPTKGNGAKLLPFRSVR